MSGVDISMVRTMMEKIHGQMASVIIGKDREIDLILASVLAGGHVLLEDVPGTGKTTLAKALAHSVDGAFARIQFTPDLLPSDVTGTSIYRQDEGVFRFVKGPVFCHVLLADEINRATPRTQSALLECMEEHQVTEGGVTYPLEAPFLVIATENPVETQGTFPLPEAQLDRFLIQLSLGYPSEGETVRMLRRFQTGDVLGKVQAVAASRELVEAADFVKECHIGDELLQYIARLCEALRDPEKVRLGPSPRAALALMRMSQAWAVMQGRDYVIPDDVKLLAGPVLAHRILMRGMAGKKQKDEFLQEVLRTLQVPTEERA